MFKPQYFSKKKQAAEPPVDDSSINQYVHLRPHHARRVARVRRHRVRWQRDDVSRSGHPSSRTRTFRRAVSRRKVTLWSASAQAVAMSSTTSSPSVAAARLRVDLRLSTWDLRSFTELSDFLVAVLAH